MSDNGNGAEGVPFYSVIHIRCQCQVEKVVKLDTGGYDIWIRECEDCRRNVAKHGAASGAGGAGRINQED